MSKKIRQEHLAAKEAESQHLLAKWMEWKEVEVVILNAEVSFRKWLPTIFQRLSNMTAYLIPIYLEEGPKLVLQIVEVAETHFSSSKN